MKRAMAAGIGLLGLLTLAISAEVSLAAPALSTRSGKSTASACATR